MIDCLNTIIGLSQTECPCYPATDLPEGLDTDTSDSGLFLDELEGLTLKLIDSASGCGDDSVWALMDKARTQAIHELNTKLLMNIASRYKLSREPYKGLIGGATYAKNLLTSAGLMELKLHTYNLPGSAIKLKRIAVLGSGVLLEIPVSIYKESYVGNSYGERELITTINVPMNGGGANYAIVPLQYAMLPCDGSRYTFEYEYDGSYYLRNNEFCCMCEKKCAYLWKYVRQGLSSNSPKSLSLDVEINCNAESLICDNVAANNDIMLSVAYAVMYKAAEKLIYRIVNSTDINRYTMLGTAQLQANASAFLARYNEFVEWLSGPDGLNVEYNSCYVCKGSTQGIRQAIY